LFQVDLDKRLNYLWCCYEKQWCWRWGCRGCKRSPKSFSLLKIWAKSPENPDKNSAQRCLASKDIAKGLHKNTWRPCFGGYTKEVFMIFVGEKCWQKLQKNFSGKFGEIRAKSFAPQTLLHPGAELGGWQGGHFPPKILPGLTKNFPRDVMPLE